MPSQVQLPATQRCPAEQAGCVPQRQPAVVQASAVVELQGAQGAPGAPHEENVGVWQLVPAQQPLGQTV